MMLDQVFEGDGADIFAAGEAKPIAALRVCRRPERHGFLPPIRGSSPLSKRRMFSW